MNWTFISDNLLTRWSKIVNPKKPLPENPRPNFQRKKWINLNGLWDFAITKRNDYSNFIEKGEILVPFPIESALSGVRRLLKPDENLIYVRDFEISSSWTNGKVILHFGAVDWQARVFVNSNYIGSHKGGYTPFSFDISKYVLFDESNTLEVHVFDPTNKGRQERGKQVLKPWAVFYTAVSGIWQTVWLECVPEVHVESITITPKVDTSSVIISNFCSSANVKDFEICYSIFYKGKKIEERKSKINSSEIIKLSNAYLWSPKEPNIYDLEIELIKENETIDKVTSYFGLRKIEYKKDENGYFRIVGETPFSLREANAPGGGASLPGPYVHAYVINSSGAILYANDMGKYGAQKYPPIALMDREEVFLQVVVFKCSSLVLYNCIEPDKVKPAVGLRFIVNDIRSHSEPESYGVTLNPYLYNGHVAMIFVPPKVPVEVIMYFSYEEQPLATLINASSSYPTGIGYVLSEGECISFTPYNYAKDFYWLTCYYVNKAASNYISDNFVWRLNTANEYLLEAKNAFVNHAYSVFWDYSIKAWLEVWRLYKDVKSALRDAGRAFVLFCFILLPSVILMERLIQFSTGNKKLLFILIVVAVIFALSYHIHPGLRIVPNPLMTAIGVAILSLTIPLTYIIISKVFSILRGYRLETIGRHFTEMGRGQAMWLALNMGCGHAKKRPIRTMLNLTLMVITTASLVSLTSFSSEVAIKPTITFTGQTNYPGVLIISEMGSDPIQPQIVEALRIEYGNKAIIAPRAYGWSGSVGTSLAAWKIFWNIEYEGKHDNRGILTVLGLTPEESMVSGLDKALIDGTWFTEANENDYVCIISDQTAQRLGIFNLTQPIHIKWEGMDYKVIGIFDSNLVNSILDLDQNPLVPPDIWSSPYQDVSVVRVNSANTIFIPYENALSLGFQVYSVGIAFHEESYQEINEKAIEMLKRFRRLTYVGCLLYTSPSPRDLSTSRMPSSA